METLIDFVMIWVDGNDPDWKEEKSRYQPGKNTDDRDIRYKDWDNLQYWFRGVEKYAPWVNRIHFVTWGHLPSWLNTTNPKLHIVKHEDFIPKEYLPTFSANVIELNLHRIPGLAEQFVYFNDDTFLGKPVLPEDFFVDGLRRDSLIENTIPPERESTAPMIFNNVAVINKHFKNKHAIQKANLKKWFYLGYGKRVFRTVLLFPWKHILGFYDDHVANAYTKSLIKEVWEAESELLTETCQHKFRSENDVTQYVFRYWSLASGRFMPRPVSVSKFFEIKENNTKMYKAIATEKYKLFCCNDGVNYTDFFAQKDKLKSVFEGVLPLKSKYEL